MGLVILHTALEATKGETKFLKNRFYRHIDFGDGTHVINGEHFTDVEFKSLFEDAMAKVKRDWIELGLLKPNGSKISKTAFKELADVHEYGSGRKTLKVLYFRKTKDVIYGFYPDWITKSDSINQAYDWYLQTLNNNYRYLDNKDICFGNCGIPLAYGKLRIN
jgi:hypothetical protein